MRTWTLLLLSLSPVAAAQGLTLRPTAPSATPAQVRSANVPAGWRTLSGSVRAERPVSLPAGSTMQVSVEQQRAGKTVISSKINFPVTQLGTSYLMHYNPQKLGGGTYLVVARVMNASGRTLYVSQGVALPQGQQAVVNLKLVPVR